MKRTAVLALVAMVTLLAPGMVSAASIANNFAGADAGFNLSLSNTGDQRHASSFRVGGTAHTLDSVTVRMQHDAGTAMSIQLVVYADNGSGAPDFGTIIETLPAQNVEPTVTTMTDFVYNSVTNPLLSANTTYWVALERLSGGVQVLTDVESDTANSGTAGSFPEHGLVLNSAPPVAGFDLYKHIQGTPGAPPGPDINVSDGPNTTDPNIPDGGTASDFANTDVGLTDTKTFNVDNIAGGATLTLSGITFTGGNAGDFSVGAFPASIAAGGDGTFVVTFTPSAAGARTTTMRIASNDGDEDPYDITLNGVGTNPGAPEINVSDGAAPTDPNIADGGTAANFGLVDQSSGSAVRPFTIDNIAGTAPLTVTGVSFTGAASGDFSHDIGGFPLNIPAGSAATFNVTFDPSSVGPLSATMQIASNDADENPYDITVEGSGADIISIVNNHSGAGAAFDVSLSSSGDQRFASAFTIGAIPHTVDKITARMQHDSGGTMNVRAVIYADNGAAAPDFGTVIETFSTVAVDNSVTTMTNFVFSSSSNPLLSANTTYWVALERVSGGIQILVDIEQDTANTGIAGTFPEHGLVVNSAPPAAGFDLFKIVTGAPGTAPGPDISVHDGATTADVTILDGGAASDFADTDVGMNDTKTFNIDNIAGSTDLTVSGISFSGGDAADFAVSGISFPAVITSGSDTTFVVTFTPSATGVRTTTMQIASDDPEEDPYDISLTGTGTSPGVPEINVSDGATSGDPDIADGGAAAGFGLLDVGSGSTVRTFNIDNIAGGADLNVSTISTSGGAAGDFVVGGISLPVIVAAGSDTTFTVTFDPTAAGLRTTTLQIASDDADEDPYDITLNGTGANIASIVNNHSGADAAFNGSLTSTGDQRYASAFSVGATPHDLHEVTVRMQHDSGGTMQVRVVVYADNGSGAPDFGTVIETLPTQDVDNTAVAMTNFVFNSPTNPTLAAGTTYWVAVERVAGGISVLVDLEADTANTGTAGTFPELGTVVNSNPPVPGFDLFKIVTGAPGVPPGPEIDVTGQGISIAGDGTNTPAAADDTNFGSVECGIDPPVVHTFTINNTGDTLNLTGAPIVQLSGSTDFSVTQQPTTPVAALTGTTTFDITFTPSSPGAKSASVSIANDDPDENPYTFNIAATGTDTSAPVITLTGADPLEIECNIDTYTDPGVSALDACDGDVSGSVIVGGDAVDDSTPGSYTVTYNVMDSSGNPATEVTRVVNVVDTTDPVINGAKDIVVTVPVGGMSDPIVYSLTAVDACDPSPTLVCTPPSGSTFPVGVNPVSCTATDSSGNEGTAMFNVIVLEIQDTPGTRYLDAISIRGDTATGATGTIFTVNRAFLNNSGGVIFDAALSGAGTNNYAVFTGPVAGPVSAIAVKGTPSGVGDYGLFSNLALNDAGDDSFQSQVGANQAQFVDTGGGPAVSAVRLGTAPTGGGEQYVVLNKPALASNGELLTPASLLLGSGGGVTVAEDTLIVSSAGTVLAREGSASSIPATNYGQFLSRVVASEDNDRYAFSALLNEAVFDPTDNAGLFVGVLGGAAPAAVVRKGDPAAGTGGAAFSSFAGEAVNSAGEYALRAYLSGAGVSAANSEGIWTNSGNIGSPPALVAREGDVAPCLPHTLAAFDRFSKFHIEDNGDIVFFAFLKNATATQVINSGNDGSLWKWSNGQLHLLVREGDLANNTSAVVRTILTFDINSSGGVVYEVSFVTSVGDTLTSNNEAIYLDRGMADVVPELILRRGDTFDFGGTETTVVGLGFSAESNAGGGTGGYGRALNDDGDVLLNLTLSGGSSGIFLLGSAD